MFTDQTQLEREKKMQHAMLDIKKKYGKNAIVRGMNLKEGATATSCVCIPTYEISRVFAELQHSYFINNQAIIPCNRNHYSEISFLTRCMYRGTMYKTLLL